MHLILALLTSLSVHAATPHALCETKAKAYDYVDSDPCTIVKTSAQEECIVAQMKTFSGVDEDSCVHPPRKGAKKKHRTSSDDDGPHAKDSDVDKIRNDLETYGRAVVCIDSNDANPLADDALNRVGGTAYKTGNPACVVVYK